MRSLPKWLTIAIIIDAFFCACNVRNSTQIPATIDTALPSSQNVEIEELYETAPINSVNQNDWVQWEIKYQGLSVSCTGRFTAISINPISGKLFFIVSIFRQDNQELSSTQLAFWVEDAYSISLGEEEGSFWVNDSNMIRLGNDYDVKGKAVTFSQFDADLVTSGYNDIVIIQGKSQDIKILLSENGNDTSNHSRGDDDNLLTEKSSESDSLPLHSTAFYPQDLPEESISPIWNSSEVSCEEKPIFMWGSPGTYIYKVINKRGESYYVTVKQGSFLEKPGEDECQMPWPNFGNRILELPKIGLNTDYYYDGCGFDESRPPGTVSMMVSGFEEKTTGLGIYQALKVDEYQNYNFYSHPPNYPEGTISTSEWYVCGIGLIESRTLHIGKYQHRDFRSEYGLELISFTPTSTNLPLVRYILADIQLGNLADEYRSNDRYEEIAHSLRLWDAGIRVENIDEFERKVIDGQWQIVYKGTEITIIETDVFVTSD